MGYAVMLHLEKRNAVIVGGGRVAARKVRSLLDAGAKITVISPSVSPSIAGAVHVKLIKWVQSAYEAVTLADYQPFIVIAATGNPDVNTQVGQDARSVGALFSAAGTTGAANGGDDSANSDFSAMMTVKQPPITVGISTDGTSPALAARLRERLRDEIEALIGTEYATLAAWLGEIRPAAKAALETSDDRRDLFHKVLDSDVFDLLKAGHEAEARALFDTLVNEVIQEAQ